MECKRCGKAKSTVEFYARDSTCKDCRKKLVLEYRARNIEGCREYDRSRSMLPHRVQARLEYQSTEKGSSAMAAAKRRWIEQNPVKRAAQKILGNAVRCGRVAKPGRCENCESTSRIHGHHDDYAFPLKVRWLCSLCHAGWHKANGGALNG